MTHSSTYSKEQTNLWRGSIAIVLMENQNTPMTIPEIQAKDMTLTGISPQKMARMLTDLYNQGMINKTKGSNGKMVYWVP